MWFVQWFVFGLVLRSSALFLGSVEHEIAFYFVEFVSRGAR